MPGDDFLHNVGSNQPVNFRTEVHQLIIDFSAPGQTPCDAEFRLLIHIDHCLGEDLLAPVPDAAHAGNTACQEKKFRQSFSDALAHLAQPGTEYLSEGFPSELCTGLFGKPL